MKKKTPTSDELRMKSEDFDRIMRGILRVHPEPKPKKQASRKKAAKSK